MTDLTVWEVSPVNTVIDHVISRYHNTHRAQLEELVPLAHKIASTSPDGFPAELPELLEYIQNELLMHMMKEERMLFPSPTEPWPAAPAPAKRLPRRICAAARAAPRPPAGHRLPAAPAPCATQIGRASCRERV